MFNDIVTEDFIRKNISEKLHDKYQQTAFAGYSFLSNANKGIFGELFTTQYLENRGHVVLNRDNPGHDRIVDGIRTEIKFSLADYDKPFQYVLNHVSLDKQWDRLIYTIINSNEQDFKMIWFTKDAFKIMLETTNLFNPQQGGKSLNNDDYMVSGQNKILKLINHPLVNCITAWQI